MKSNQWHSSSLRQSADLAGQRQMPALVPFWPRHPVGYWSYVWVCSPWVRTCFGRVPLYSERAWDPGKSAPSAASAEYAWLPAASQIMTVVNNEQLPFIEYLLCESSQNLNNTLKQVPVLSYFREAEDDIKGMPWSRAPNWTVPPGCAPKPVWLSMCSSPLCSSTPDSSCLSHPLWDAVITHSPLAMEKPVLLGQPHGVCRQTLLTGFPWAMNLLSFCCIFSRHSWAP